MQATATRLLPAPNQRHTSTECDLAVRHIARHAAGSWDIAGSGVIHHHAVRAKSPCQRTDRVHHHLDPLPRQTVGIPVVEQRNDLILQHLLEGLAIAAIGDFVV